MATSNRQLPAFPERSQLERPLYFIALFLIFFLPWRGPLVIAGGITIARVVGASLGLLWLLHVSIHKRVRQPALFHLVAVLWIGWMGLSSFWSLDVIESLYVFISTASGVVVALILWDLFRTRRDTWLAAAAYVAGCYIVMLIEGIGYLFLDATALGSITAGPNYVAARLIFAFPLAWFLYTNTDRRRVLRYFGLAYVILCPIAVLLTKSRQGLVTMVIGLTVVILAQNYNRGSLKRLITFGVGMIASIVVSLSILTGGQLGQVLRFENIEGVIAVLRGGTLDESLATRLGIYEAGIEVFMSNFLLGIGAGSFDIAVAPILGYAWSPHNSYLAVAAETGIIGIGLFLGLLFMLTRGLFASRYPFSTASITILVIYITISLTNSWHTGFEPWLLFTFVLWFTRNEE